VESFDNDLTELKRRIEQDPQKLVNANQRRRNNNLNADPKSDKIVKDIIAPKSRNSKNSSFVVPD